MASKSKEQVMVPETSYNLEALLDENMKGKRRPEQVERIVCYILEQDNRTNEDNAYTSKQIIEKYKALRKKQPDLVEIPENSLTVNISLLAGSSSSHIFKSPKQGYFFRKDTDTEAEEIVEFQEKDLYPILVQWLSLRCERVNDISSSRGMKTWGNPDVVGLDYDIFFSNNIIEVTTIEAKKDKSKWRLDIFEAVSHSMFANKAYYAYLCKESDKIDEDMLLYAQKFGIGILAIAIPDKQWGKDMKLKTEFIKEVIPAPNHNVILKFQMAFFNGLKINDIKDINKFGHTNTELTAK